MSFYKRFAEYYDEIFPVDHKKVAFLEQKFSQSIDVLDLGCATGGYTIALSNKNYKVDGIDLSKEMIELAKLKQASHSPTFWVDDMKRLDAINRYDGIYSIGNTIVHLTTLDEIFKVLKRIYQALKQKGVFIIQIINYDRVLNDKLTSLPTIESPNVSFIRNYLHKPPLVEFHTQLVFKDDVFKDVTELFPMRSEELISMLKKLGFKDIRAYSGFSEKPYQKDDAFQLVIEARKDE